MTTPSPQHRPRSPLRDSLQRSDYERVFDVLERCDTAASLPDFKECVIEALEDTFALKHVSFFSGATFHNVFGDSAPLTEGKTARMLPEYRERWARYDVFGTPAAMRQLVASGVSSLAELSSYGPLPATADAYVRHFLVATWRMETAAAMRLILPGGHTALIGMFDPAPDKIGATEAATLRLLSRQLSATCRGLPVSRPQATLAKLSERQRQVVQLVAEGLSNAEIGEALSLAEDSVKKYVSRILTATSCQSRMELALLARSQGL
ncbi:LuxR family transcriptional regulator [Skermania sp. ID1734]|uniref:helix-turn-helix transcriptional regulator n=1 Tax=Skermania sp. ID1734 TaxID=2597516 RepID=UPI00117C1B1B|nr:LuxR C-terminal-related transcriptional regulator [Skermania sp. ID1734]TSE01124.1 LuxR family transcriptional regulator [Skermania sp. ID1734]